MIGRTDSIMHPYVQGFITFVILTIFAMPYLYGSTASQDLVIRVDMKQPGIPLPRTWKASQKLVDNSSNRIPSGYVLSKWQNEIGFSGDFRLSTELFLISRGQICLQDFADLACDIVSEGGTPFLTILGIPDNLMSEPGDLGMPPGTCPWLIRPNDLEGFKEMLKNYMLYFSGKDLILRDNYLFFEDTPSQGIDGIYFHFWVEPTGYNHWQDDFEEFNKMYDRFIQAAREIRQEYPEIDFKVGGIHLNCWVWDRDCRQNNPYDPDGARCTPLYFLEQFLDYCTDAGVLGDVRVCAPPLDIEFFSFQTNRNNNSHVLTRNLYGDYSYIKTLLDQYGYQDTSIVRADMMGQFHRVRAQYLPGYDFHGEDHENWYAGCEADNEIGASELPALLYDTTRSVNIPVDRYYFEFIRDVMVRPEEEFPDLILDHGLYMGNSGVGYAGGSLPEIQYPLAKAGYNVIRMIGALEDTLLEVEYVERFNNSNDLIRAVATRDSETNNLAILIWYYINPNQFQDSWDEPVSYSELRSRPELVPRTVKLRIQNTSMKRVHCRQFLMDKTHSNPWNYRSKIALEMVFNQTITPVDVNEWPGCGLDMVEEWTKPVFGCVTKEMILDPYSVALITVEPKGIYHSLN